MEVLGAPADFWATAGRLALATLLGGLIGLNRELSGKPAGLRTHALVSLAGSLAGVIGMQLSIGVVGDYSAPGRIIQGMVAGVGFIGGGAILIRDRAETTHGLTTAASIWVVSVVGLAAGVGLWMAASFAVAIALLVLAAGRHIDEVLRKSND